MNCPTKMMKRLLIAALAANLSAQPALAEGVDTRPAVEAGLCGDAIVDANEQCDPGADPTCDDRCTPEAYALPRGQASITGAVPAMRVDRIAFTVDDETAFEARTHGGEEPCLADTTLTLRRDGEMIAFDDDGGEGLCSAMEQALPPGDYALEVAGYGGGEVALHVTDVEHAVAMSPNRPARGRVQAGEADRFVLDWPGGPATIDVTDGAEGCPGDAMLTVIGPGGRCSARMTTAASSCARRWRSACRPAAVWWWSRAMAAARCRRS